MEKPKEIKELTKLPKALQLKTKNETLFICKLIDKIKKNTIPTEFQEKAETELQKLLLKTKDATKALLRFNIIDELGFKDIAILFKDKAIELGYSIQENKNIKNIMENIQEQNDTNLIDTIKQHFLTCDIIDGIPYVTNIPGAKIVKSVNPGRVKLIGLKEGDMVPVVQRSNGDLINMKVIYIGQQGIILDDNSGLEIEGKFVIEETEDNIFTGRLYVVESKVNENTQEVEVKTYDCNMTFKIDSQFSNEEQVKDFLETQFQEIDSIYDKEITVIDNLFGTFENKKIKESIEQFDKAYQILFDEKLLPAYRNIKKSLINLGEIADKLLEQHKEKQLYTEDIMKINSDLIDIKVMFSNMQLAESTKINEKLRGVKVIFENGEEIVTDINGTDEEIKDYYRIGKTFNLGNAPVQGDGNYGDNMQKVKEVIILDNHTNEPDKDVTTVEEAVQQMFIYDKNELSKLTIFEGDELPEVVIPEYNPATLKKLIENDPFLAFSYRTLMTGNETEDLDMVYKTHIKGDSDMEARLKTFESYTFSVYEKMNSKDPYATFIINSFKSINEGIGSDIVNTVSSKLHSFTNKVKEIFSLSTNDVRNEIRTLFSSMTLEEFVSKLKNSGITAKDFKTNENAVLDVDLTVKEKIAKAFSLSLGGAGLISMIGSILLPTLLNISVLGKFNITYLFGVGIFLLISAAAGLISLTKND